LLFGTTIVGADQLVIVQPKLYLLPIVPRAHAVFVGLGMLLLLLGLSGWPRPRNRSLAAVGSLLLGGLALALSGVLRFLAFSGPETHGILACLPALVALACLGRALRWSAPRFRSLFELPDGGWLWIEPFAILAFVATLVAMAILEVQVGPVRASLALGGAWVVSALLLRDETRSSTWPILVGLGELAALCGLALVVEARSPLARVLASSHPLIYSTRTTRSRLDVTSGQGGLHYFVNGELRFSSLDERRWAESLTRPALARLREPQRALVLSLGEGLIERELLHADAKLSITSVVRDGKLAHALRNQAFLRNLTTESLWSPRVTLVERDPAAYALALGREQFDVIVADLPDPSGPLEVKYYTRLFYSRLREHLTDEGLLVVQATSARRSPRSFAIIGKTLESAGFSVTPLFVPLVTRGEWSLYLCSKGPLPAVQSKTAYERSFPGSFESQMTFSWPDTRAPQDFELQANTQNDAILLEWFERESEDWNHG
jgi:spermidine synthase